MAAPSYVIPHVLWTCAKTFSFNQFGTSFPKGPLKSAEGTSMTHQQTAAEDDPLRVVIIGGGISGLCALISLRKQAPGAKITLIDRRDCHVKIPRMHEVLRSPCPLIQIAFRELGSIYDFDFIKADVSLTAGQFPAIAATRHIEVAGKTLGFDYLVLAGGLSDPAGPVRMSGCLGLGEFLAGDPHSLLEPASTPRNRGRDIITVAGAGPTGIQFAFELKEYLDRVGDSRQIHLLDAGQLPLQRFDPRIGEYVLRQMDARGLHHHPGKRLVGTSKGRLLIENSKGEQHEFQSGVTITLTGATTQKVLQVNLFGQLLLQGKPYPRLLAAGDVACFKGPIPSTVSAQSAVRKGKLIARNILASERRIPIPRPYLHGDKGYIVSLGADDAVGWVGSRRRIVKGRVALGLRELIDKQYDLFLEGIDTFIV